MALKGYGFKGDARPVGQAKLSASENRIEYIRNGITEWYVNDEKGLEQGFTLNMSPKPGKSGPNSWIVLKMDLYGNLNAVLNSSIGRVKFATVAGVDILHYDKLYAFDATGRKLASRFALAGKEIHIYVDTSQAVYPITIDPLVTSADWTAEGNQVNSRFGVSVATTGDVNGDGYSDVIVGACYYDNGQTDEGMAFVYHGSASGLSATADWTAEGNQDSALFGLSLSTAGDVNGDGYSDVIIGARGYDNGQENEGMAFVYHGSASGLSATADWTGEINKAHAIFGQSVDTAGDVNNDGFSENCENWGRTAYLQLIICKLKAAYLGNLFTANYRLTDARLG